MNYPSPCDKCSECTCPQGCEAWRIRYRYRQKQINAHARKLFQCSVAQPSTKYFTYSHPDDVRRFLRYSPCNGCQLMPDCDEPCWTYLRWYDARIELARRRIKEKDQL